MLQKTCADLAEALEAVRAAGGDPKDAGVQLIDVREPHEVATAALPFFTNLPLSRMADWAPTVADDYDPEAPTFLLCHHGIRSQNAGAWLAQNAGFTSPINVIGGIDRYSVEVDASVPRY